MPVTFLKAHGQHFACDGIRIVNKAQKVLLKCSACDVAAGFGVVELAIRVALDQDRHGTLAVADVPGSSRAGATPQ